MERSRLGLVTRLLIERWLGTLFVAVLMGATVGLAVGVGARVYAWVLAW